MRNVITETLWVAFMVLMGAAIYAAYEIVTVKPAEAMVKPIDLSRSEPRPIEPTLFYQSSKIEVSTKDFECLAHNIFYEAGIEDYEGKIAVAQVTLNRVRHGRWGNSICQVVYAKRQFSWTHQNKSAPRGPLWRASREAARDFVNGTRLHALQGSKYYHAVYIDDPRWTQNLEVVAVIGQHRFYRTPK